jgi:hypothetical protein
MKKRIIAVVSTILLLVPGILQASSLSLSDNFIPGNSLVNLDLQLPPNIKKLVEPLITEGLKSVGNENPDYEKLNLLANKFLTGDTFRFNLVSENNFILSFPATADEFSTLTNGAENVDAEATYVNGFAILASSNEAISKAVNLAKGTDTDSLANNAEYQSFAETLLSPRFFGLIINAKSLSEVAAPLLRGEEAGNAIVDLLNLVKFEGFGVAETSTGYKFHTKVTGNPEKLQAEGLTFAGGGKFTPNLYAKFPNAKPIFYSESFNPKAEYSQAKKTIEKLLASVQGLSMSFDDVQKEIKKAIGVDLDEIVSVLDKEVAFGVQYAPSSVLPYFTMMANVSTNKDAAASIVSKLVSASSKEIEKDADAKRAINISTKDGFTTFSIDLTKAQEGYDGPEFPLLTFTFGVSNDGFLIISNYPNIDKAEKRTGFAGDPDFGRLPEISQISSGISYFNVRNIWAYVDDLLDWITKVGGPENAPTLEFYQGYYSVLEKIYGWKDVFTVTQNTDYESSLTGTITIDKAKHTTYRQELSTLKSNDKDGDGVSDFQEIYVYKTPTDVGDGNHDGISDIDSLKKGLDPETGKKLFNDVPEGQYYTDSTAFLYQRGTVKGYGDGSFQPGKLVTRAEFIKMVMTTFEENNGSFLGFNLGGESSLIQPFDDVRGDWYASYVNDAYKAGFVKGDLVPGTYKRIFRPNDFITRAEALVILSKAASVLKSSSSTSDCEDANFNDVKKSDWFCSAVGSAYSNGVTKGKTKNSFSPYDNLSRAEAAVLIKRTLDKEFEFMSSGTKSVKDLSAPIENALLF